MSLEQEIRDVIAQFATTRADDIQPTDRLREDLGLDSVSSMELVSVLAENYDVDIEMEAAVNIATVGEVIELARQHIGANK